MVGEDMTHNERVLDLLSDGLPHSHHEIYRLFVIGHSRVADLRKQGYRIDQWREGDSYWYQLIEDGTTSLALMEDDGQYSIKVPAVSYERDTV